MTSRNPTLFAQLFTSALEEEIGIRVETNEPKLLRQELYKVRDLVEGASEIVMFIPPTNDCIFLAKKSVEMES